MNNIVPTPNWRPGLLALLAGVLAPLLDGQCAVTRGPYLQQAATNSIVVRWRTDSSSASYVRYGTNAALLASATSNATVELDHALNITGLEADTRYYYQIGTASAWFPVSTNDFFVTPPPTGAPKPTRIWVLGDSGTPGSDANAVRNAYTSFTGARATDLWLMLGDNAYNDGKDSEYQAAVFNMYPAYLRNSVLWPTLGNHDVKATDSAGVAPYFAIFTLPKNAEAGGIASGSEKYYSFDYANIHFVCLDSMSSSRGGSGPMCNWLKADLAATEQDWIIAFWHHPAYSKGSHDSDTDIEMIEMRQNLLPVLEDYGVDLVLTGHSHSYERSYLLDGHYGNSGTLAQSMKKDGGNGRVNGTGAYRKFAGAGQQGAVHAVAGSSSSVNGGPLNHPAMFTSLNQLGSAVIDVSSNRLDFVFLRSTGATGDYFTILKSPPPPTNPPAPPTGLMASARATNQIDLSWTDPAPDADGFKVERSINGVDFAQFAAVGAHVTNGADTGLSPGTTYFYRVRAWNVAGDSLFSDIAQATTLTPPPADTNAPAAITDLVVTRVTTNSATLLWTAPGDDAGTPSRYDARFSTATITEDNWSSATPADGVPAPAPAGDSQAFTLRGLAAGVTYYLALKTVDAGGNVSPLSNVPQATTLLNPPAPPTNLSATAISSTEIDLAWADNSGDEDGFKVERSTNAVDFVEIGSVGADVTAVADLGVAPSTTNYYRVRAFSTNGDSAYSAIAQAITPAAPLLTVFVTSNSIWKYLDDGSDPAAAWTAPGFDDSTWATGPSPLGYGGGEATTLGFGSDPENKFVTAWFRHAFEVTNAALQTNLLLELLCADGAVVYLNGVEQFRGNLPEGPMTQTNLALAAANGSSAFASNFPPDNLVAGTNVLAVEVHLSSATNSILAFDLRLIASAPGVVPDITAPAAVTNLAITSVTTNRIALAWTATGDDGYTGTAASNELRYSTGPITETNWMAAMLLNGPPAPSPSGSTQAVGVIGLNPGTTYFFALKTADEANNRSPLSNVPRAVTPGLPPPWREADIGVIRLPGQATHTNGAFTVQASGADIADKADAFHFVYQPASGDCDIIARVTGVQNTSSSAKAGVMIRESLNPNSNFGMTLLTPDKKILWLRRTSTGSSTSSSTASGSYLPPQWVRVTRTGSTFTSYRSTNGVTWTLVNAKSITMGSNVFIGLAVTSRSKDKLNTSTFDRVTATP